MTVELWGPFQIVDQRHGVRAGAPEHTLHRQFDRRPVGPGEPLCGLLEAPQETPVQLACAETLEQMVPGGDPHALWRCWTSLPEGEHIERNPRQKHVEARCLVL